MIESGLYQFLTTSSAVLALLGGPTSVYFSVLPKQPVLPAIRLFRVASPNAAETLDLPTTGLQSIAGRFQFDSIAQDSARNPANPSGYLSAAMLSEAVRAQLLAEATLVLPDGTLVQDVRIHDEFDQDFEVGGAGYIYRRALDVSIVYQEGNYPYSGGGGALTRYSNMAGTLTITGNPAVWTLSVPFTANAMVFRNGELLSPTVDYTTAGSSITFVVTPAASDNLVVMQ